MRQPTPAQSLYAMACMTALGCAGKGSSEVGPSDDRAAYTKALDATTGSPEERLQTCRQIADTELRGDCTLSIAQSMGRGTSDGALAWCPHAEAGTWRDECYFAAAESAGMRGDKAAAHSPCELAGSHEHRCRFHLFQLDTQQMAPQVPNDPTRAAEILRDIYSRHDRALDHPGGHRVRSTWYRDISQRYEIDDTSWCAPLVESDRRDCEAGVEEAVAKRKRKAR